MFLIICYILPRQRCKNRWRWRLLQPSVICCAITRVLAAPAQVNKSVSLKQKLHVCHLDREVAYWCFSQYKPSLICGLCFGLAESITVILGSLAREDWMHSDYCDPFKQRKAHFFYNACSTSWLNFLLDKAFHTLQASLTHRTTRSSFDVTCM